MSQLRPLQPRERKRRPPQTVQVVPPRLPSNRSTFSNRSSLIRSINPPSPSILPSPPIPSPSNNPSILPPPSNNPSILPSSNNPPILPSPLNNPSSLPIHPTKLSHLPHLNVHAYDGKLDLEVIKPYLDLIQDITKEVKLECGAHLLSALPHPNLSLLLQQSKTSPQSNFDPINKLWVEDLLFLLAHIFDQTDEKDSFLSNLKLQLDDMSTGLCPQGRTTRLFEIIIPYQDNLTSLF